MVQTERGRRPRLAAIQRAAGFGYAGLLLLGAAACHPRPAEAPLPPVEITDAKRISAMLSVHAHAIWEERDFPPGIEVIALADAIRILNADTDRLAPSRKRRAIAKLAAYNDGRPGLGPGIEQLGADEKRIAERLRKESEPYGDLVGKDPTLRETLISNFLPEMIDKLAIPDCVTKDFVSNVSPIGPMVTAAATIRVARDPAKVARGLDPRNWNQCSRFFRPPGDARLAHLSSTGSVVFDPPPPLPLPDATFGGTADPRFLHEEFICSAVPGCNARFENLLWVLTESTPLPVLPPRWGLYYGLQPWAGQNGQIASYPVILMEDRGGAYVLPISSSESEAHVDKNLIFDNAVANALAAAALMSNEVAGELQEIVCCVPNP